MLHFLKVIAHSRKRSKSQRSGSFQDLRTNLLTPRYRMRAKHCLLTHFSQRYPKFPPLSENQDSDATSCHIAVAFDLMSLRIRDFWKFRHFIKSFERLFSEMEADDPADAAEETASINGKDAKATAKQKAKENWKNQKEQAAAKKGKKGKEINGQAVVDAVTVA